MNYNIKWIAKYSLVSDICRGGGYSWEIKYPQYYKDYEWNIFDINDAFRMCNLAEMQFIESHYFEVIKKK